MSIPLNIPIARDLIEATGQSYPLLALRSRGGFQPYDLKNALNGVTKGLTWAKLEALARVLRCDPEALVDPDYLRLINAPMNVALRFQNLYRRSRTQIYTFYQALFQGLLSSENFARILNSSADLYLILTATEENCTMEDRLGQALESICRRYQEGTGVSCVDLGIAQEQLDWLVAQIGHSGEHSLSQRTMLLFCYSVCLLDSVFVYEFVASGLQVSMTRATQELTQYHALSIPLERLKTRLVEYLANNGAVVDGSQFEAFGIHEQIFNDCIHAVCACERCRQHLNDDSMGSEQVLRPVLHGLVTQLNKTAESIGIPSQTMFPIDHVNSRFARFLDRFKAERDRFRDKDREAIKQAEHERGMQTRQQKAEIEERQKWADHWRQVGMRWTTANIQATVLGYQNLLKKTK